MSVFSLLSRLRRRIGPVELLLLMVTAVPVVFLAWLVYQNAVPIPMLDDWEMAPLIAKWRIGGLTFHDFFVQQQEARTFFPKLLFVVLSAGKTWDVRLEMALSVAICIAIAAGIYALLRKSQLSPGASGTAFLLIVLLIFSPVQHELWLLASGFPSFIPALCIVTGLLVAVSELTLLKKFAWCGALAIFSSFSLPSGLLAWGLTFPVALIIGRTRSWKPWSLWAILCAACSLLYFYNLKAKADLPAFAPPKPAVDYVEYILGFLGSGLGRAGNGEPLTASVIIGTITILAYFAAAIYALVNWRNREIVSRLVPWFALGAYSIACAALAALGRIGWGVSQALESRYVAFSLYLFVAVIALAALIARDLRHRMQSQARWRAVLSALLCLGGACLVLHVRCATASLEMFSVRSAAARLGYGGVLFSQVLDTSEVIEAVNYPRAPFVRVNADLLDKLHLLRPPLFRTLNINEMRASKVDDRIASGWIDSTAKSPDGRVTAFGWAVLNAKRRPADCVVLAFSVEDSWKVFAISSANVSRPDVASQLHDSRYRLAGWHATYPATSVPAGARISAWAVDARDAKLYQLNTAPGLTGE